MSADGVSAALLRAAAIVRAGWCKGMTAKNEYGVAVVATAPTPPHILPKERAGAPVAFDIGSAIFRACARQTVPQRVKKEDARLLHWSVWEEDRRVFAAALGWVCRVTGVMHHAEANDRCKSADEAVDLLERAALACGDVR